ncbi:MAG: GxxExxY protein [Pyrinomonadaceae bacterium]
MMQMRKSGRYVEKQKALPLIYESVKMECGYRIDLLVNKRIIVEVKVVDTLSDVHLAQVLTYLRLANLESGLLLNFNVVRIEAAESGASFQQPYEVLNSDAGLLR